MATKRIPPYIKPAGYLRNGGSFLIDLGFALLTMLILFFAFGQPVIYGNLLQGPSYTTKYNDLAKESGFAYEDGEGHIKEFVQKADLNLRNKPRYQQYTLFVDQIWHYFYDVVPSSEKIAFQPSDGFASDFEKGSEGYRRDAGKWVYSSFFGIDESGKGTFFTYPSDADFDFNKAPVLDAATSAASQSADEKTSTDALQSVWYYIYENGNSRYKAALAHFQNQPVARGYKDTQLYALYFSAYPSILIGSLVFFFLIPMLSRNGQTLGKKILHVAVIGSDGFTAPKWKIGIHYGLIVLPFLLLMIPYVIVTLMVFFLYFLVDYIVMLMQKNHQSVHDLASMTIVINSESSLWFPSPESRDKYITLHPSSFPALYQRELETGITKESQGRKEAATDALAAEQEGIVDSRTLERAAAIQEQAKEAAKEIVYDNDADPKGEGDFVDGKGEDDAH